MTVPPMVTSWARETGTLLALAEGQKLPQNLTYGFAAGFCAGYAFKQVAKVVAVGVGLVFVGLQTLQYKGFITIDHTQMEGSVHRLLDLNKDGKIDEKDMAIAKQWAFDALEQGVPAGGGFAAGTVMGMRMPL